jgi:hypothetical protein
MSIPYRVIALTVIVATLGTAVFQRAQAGGGHYYPPVVDPLVKEECGSCHLPYAPAMLPARSWQRLMGDLKNHFGDDASVEPALAERISSYLVANAGDTGGARYGSKLSGSANPGSTPLRISELPKWQRAHRKVPAWEWSHKDVRTKANCLACHADAGRGYYDE